jgi:two-component system chemotaxis response regulator CheB
MKPSAKKQVIEAVVIGASAGGVQALLALLADLPRSFRLPLIVVLHLPEGRESQLPEIFQYRLPITVREAVDKESIAPSTLYFACPGYHLSVEMDRTFSLSCEEASHYSRPSIDFLMTSAADAYGASLAGILLTGANADGAIGLARISQQGGVTVVQDPAEAEVATMPEAAIRKLRPNFILGLGDIRAWLLKLDQADDA